MIVRRYVLNKDCIFFVYFISLESIKDFEKYTGLKSDYRG